MLDLHRLFVLTLISIFVLGCPDDDDDSGDDDDATFADDDDAIDDDDAADDDDSGDDDDAADDDDSADDDDDDAADDDDAVNPEETFTWVFDNVVDPICTCHAGASHSTGFAFNGDKATLHSVWVDVASSELPSMDRVEPGDAANSYVMNKLDGTHNDVGGSGGQMPLSGCCLDESTRDNIRAWINNGALDN